MMRLLLGPDDWLGDHQGACLCMIVVLVVAVDWIAPVA